MELSPAIKIAGVLYTQDSGNRSLLWVFADRMKSRGWRVGGLVQDILLETDGSRFGVDAVAMDDGERVPIARATAQSRANKECILDHAALTGASQILRRAVEHNLDLVVVEKFGEQEQQGAGLMDDILACAAAGIPVLVAVPAHAIEQWRQISGGLGPLLPWEDRALQRWWGGDQVLPELTSQVADTDVRRVVVGVNWTLVEGTDGCGLAQSPAKGSAGCRALDDAGELSRQSLRQLAQKTASMNPYDVAIGVAAINAHFNRYDLQGSNENGLDTFVGQQGTITCIGRFPALGDRYANLNVIEMNPEVGEYPETATERVVAASDGLLMTSSVLVNHSFARIMNARGDHTEAVMVGPGTPITPVLGHYGVAVVSGLVVEDVDAAAQIIAEGGAVKKLKKVGRQVNLRFGVT